MRMLLARSLDWKLLNDHRIDISKKNSSSCIPANESTGVNVKVWDSKNQLFWLTLADLTYFQINKVQDVPDDLKP